MSGRRLVARPVRVDAGWEVTDGQRHYGIYRTRDEAQRIAVDINQSYMNAHDRNSFQLDASLFNGGS